MNVHNSSKIVKTQCRKDSFAWSDEIIFIIISFSLFIKKIITKTHINKYFKCWYKYVWEKLLQTYLINVYDMETYEEGFEIKVYCICAVVNNQNFHLYYGDSENIIISSLENICKLSNENFIEIYIHNLNFDGMLLINSITFKKISFNLFSRGTNLYYLDIFYSLKTIRFRCSYKLIGISLKKVGEIEDFPKKFFPYSFVNSNTLNYFGTTPEKKYWNLEDYGKIDISSNFNLKKECIAYCFNDVFLTQKMLYNLFSSIDIKFIKYINFSFSAASLSNKIYYKHFNNKNTKINIPVSQEVFIRKSYYGGRTEVFGNLEDNEHVKYFDFSGMYAQCMKEKFHLGDGEFSISSSVNDVGFHTIRYESKNMWLPILPCYSNNDKLIFANGDMIGTFWWEEIQLFIEKGGVVKEVIQSLIFKQYDFVFDEFIEYFEKIKLRKGYYKIFGKLMINSFYGSTGLRNQNEIMYITFSENEYEYIHKNLTVLKFYKINFVFILIILEDYKISNFKKKININKFKEERSKRNVSYASAITSKARIKLFKALCDVIEDGGRLLYCDTDSIFAAYKKEDTRVKFGQYEWIKFYNDAVFVSPKMYGISGTNKNEIKIKGIDVKNIDFLSFKNFFYNNESFLFNDQLQFFKKDFLLSQKHINKSISMNTYDKRVFIENKKKTIPLKL